MSRDAAVDPDVVVVGAGPVGLTLALGLARAGRRVLVLEKEPATSERSRAPAIWPRTQEILDALGVLGRFADGGIVISELRVWDADRERPLLTLPLGELAGETPWPRLLILPQSDTERLLHDAVAGEPTGELLFSAEVTDLADEGSRVRVAYRLEGRSEEVAAAFVAGCDGAHSTVRERIGAGFEGTTYDLRVALADVTLEEDRELPFPRVSTRDGLAIGIRIEASLWRLILPSAPEDDRSLEARIGAAAQDLFGVGLRETVWRSEFRIHRRIASRFVSGRVVLAGDAAHLNSPVGGQGMNAGIQDAEVLTDALLEALERDDPGPLDGYERVRRAAVTGRVNPFTDRLTRLLLPRGGRFVKAIFRVADVVLRVGPLRRWLLRRLAMLR